jgi:hypothetical protein
MRLEGFGSCLVRVCKLLFFLYDCRVRAMQTKDV